MGVYSFKRESQKNFRNIEVKIPEIKEWRRSAEDANYFEIGYSCNVEQITIKQPEKIFISFDKTYMSLSSELLDIKRTIEESRYILDLKDDWDDNGAIAPSKDLYKRAISLLVKYAEKILQNHNTIIKAPEINPGRNGSIDLDWRCGQIELLINVNNDEGFQGSYYGDNCENNSAIEGLLKVGVDEIDEDLAHWMRKLN